MKIGILLPTNVYMAPYVRLYTDILDEVGCDYDVIYFDKRNMEEKAAYRFSAMVSTSDGQLKRLWGYLRFSIFLRKVICKEKYDKLIICGPQIALFMYGFLKKHYAGRFIMDYRDLSIEQRFMSRYKKILSISAFNVISSPGFKRCLPAGDYILSHNIREEMLREHLSERRDETRENLTRHNGKISVLTIGGIRDYEQNAAVMVALANKDGFETSYIGRGEEGADVKLKDLAQREGIKNVYFSGFYQKEEEPDIISSCTFLNIFYPRKISHDTALSNRFYSSLIFRKPMITTADTTQGDYAVKYGVGVALTDTSKLDVKLRSFIDGFDADAYEKNRNMLLRDIYNDCLLFKDKVWKFACGSDKSNTMS